jgi:hypothetical protein
LLAHLTTEVKLRLFENYEIDTKKFKAIGINLNILESIGSGIKFTLFHKLRDDMPARCRGLIKQMHLIVL